MCFHINFSLARIYEYLQAHLGHFLFYQTMTRQQKKYRAKKRVDRYKISPEKLAENRQFIAAAIYPFLYDSDFFDLYTLGQFGLTGLKHEKASFDEKECAFVCDNKKVRIDLKLKKIAFLYIEPNDTEKGYQSHYLGSIPISDCVDADTLKASVLKRNEVMEIIHNRTSTLA